MVVWVGILERFAEVGGGVADDVVEAETKFERNQFQSSGRPEMDGCPVAGRPVGSDVRCFLGRRTSGEVTVVLW